MTLQEILQSAGVEEAAVNKILSDMTTNKIYTTNVENADVRYSKLKEKAETLTAELGEANTQIENFKNQNPEQLKADYTKLLADHEALQGESAKKLKNQAIDFNIKEMMKNHKAKSKYADLLQAKIDKESLQLADDGTVAGLEDLFTNLKTEYSDLFEAPAPSIGGVPPVNNGNSGSENSALVDQIRNSINRK